MGPVGTFQLALRQRARLGMGTYEATRVTSWEAGKRHRAARQPPGMALLGTATVNRQG